MAYGFHVHPKEYTADVRGFSFVIEKDGDVYKAYKSGKGLIFEDNDASTVIQSVLNSLTKGGLVFIKSGDYELSSTLSFSSKYIIIVGEGAGSTRLIFKGGVNGIEISKETTRPWFKLVDIVLRADTSGSGYGILADDVSRIEVNRCLIEYFEIGVYLRNRVWDGKITNSWLYENTQAIKLENDCTNILIEGNTIGGTNTSLGVGVTRGSDGVSRGNTIIGNWFETGAENNTGILIDDAYHNKVIANIFATAVYKAVDINGVDASAVRNIVEGNIFYNSGTSVHIHGTNALGNVVKGNTFYGSAYGVYISGAESNVVIGNVFLGCDVGIRLDSGSDRSVVSSNSIRDGTTAGIQVVDVSKCIISQNHVYNSERGIGEGGTADYNIISDNILEANATYNLSTVGTNTLATDNKEI